MPKKSTPLKIVIAGDSLSTAFGLPARSLAFPQILRSRLGETARVTSLSRPDRMVGYTLDRIDRIIAVQPDVVILWHGGREATFTHTFPLAQLAIDLTKKHPWTLGGTLRRLKQALYFVLRAVTMSSFRDRVPALLRIRPGMTASHFFDQYQHVVTQLTEKTGAQIFVILTYVLGTNQFPYSRSRLAENNDFLRGLDDGGRRIIIIDGGAELRLSAQNFLSDRCHFAQEGHAMMAALIEKHLRMHGSLQSA